MPPWLPGVTDRPGTGPDGRTGVDALLLSHGADLPWLTGYRAMPLERLTMLVVPADGDPVLVVPALEAPRVAAADTLFSLRPWTDTEDPIDLVVSLVAATADRGTARRLAISDRAWATTLLALQRRLPDARWIEASTVTSPAPGGQGRAPSWTPCARPGRPPTGWRPSCRQARSR